MFIKTRKLCRQYSLTVWLGEQSPSFMQSVRLHGWSGKEKRRHKAEKTAGGEGLLFLRLDSLPFVTGVLLQDKTVYLYYWVDWSIL